MDQFELHTALLVVALTSLAQSGVMAYVFLIAPRGQGAGHWTLANAAFAVACVALLLRGFVPELASVLVSNGCILLGVALLYVGLTRFIGAPAPRLLWPYLPAFGVLPVLGAYTLVWPNLGLRIASLSFALAALLVPIVWLLLRRTPAEVSLSARFTAAVFGLAALATLVRGAGAVLWPVPDVFTADVAQSVGLVGALLAPTLGTVGLGGMVAQRMLATRAAELDGRRAAEDALRASEARARQQVQALEALSQTLAEVAVERDLPRVLEQIVQRSAQLLGVDTAELLIYDAERGDLPLAARFPYVAEQEGYRQAIGEGSLGQVARTKQSLILNNYREWSGALPESTTLGLLATLDVPLLQGDELVGVLGVGVTTPGRRFEADDERLLTLFARQATVAIVNARLTARLLVDALTGVHTRGRFFALAEEALAAAGARAWPIAVAIVDLDSFKQINDTAGHGVGDDVLRWVASEICAALPEGALVGRIGGEEFAVCLPGADEAGATAALERVRRRIAQTPVPTRAGGWAATISVGVAERELRGGTTIDQLLERADRALYHAKQSGRNRVCCASSCPEAGVGVP